MARYHPRQNWRTQSRGEIMVTNNEVEKRPGMKRVDCGGYAGKIPSVRLMTALDFSAILSDTDPDTEVTICTYNLSGPIDQYIACMWHLKNCTLIVTKLTGAYRQLFEKYLSNIRLVEVAASHAKIILIAPNRVYLSSQNLFQDGMFQHAEMIEDEVAYNLYKKMTHGRGGNLRDIWGESYSEDLNYDPVFQGNVVPDSEGIILKNVRGKYQTMLNYNGNLNSIYNRDIIICTYTLPNKPYVTKILEKLVRNGNRITLIANSVMQNRIKELEEVADFDYHLFDNVHAKMILCSKDGERGDNITLLSSQNFGLSTWFENTLRLKGEKPYTFYKQKIEEFTGFPFSFS